MPPFRALLVSIAHTRASQLLARGRRIAKRAIVGRIPSLARERLRRQVGRLAPRIAGEVPRPLARRSGMLRRDGAEIVLTLLNRETRMPGAIGWRAASDDGAPQLFGFHLHYHEYLEEAADDDFLAIVRDWIAANPPYAPGSSYDAWSPYALSLRMVVWMQEIGRRRGALPEDFLAVAARSLAEQALFLESNLELDVRGNHLIKNIKALLFAAKCLSVPASARWRERGTELLAQELHEQILPDGFHFERSPAYHAQVFADLLECHEVLDPGGLKALLASRLSGMARALADTTHPDGLCSLFNDGGLRMTYVPGDLLGAWSAISGESLVPRREIRLEAAGYFGLRDASDYLLVDAGRIAPDFLPAHGHGDILAFEWSVGGRRIVVDTGVYEYAAGERRRRSRATPSHSTVSVDDADQCEFYGSFRVGRRASVAIETLSLRDGHIELCARHDGFRRLPGVSFHRRSYRGAAARFTIEDAIDGTKGAAEAFVVLHPDVRARIDGSTARLASDGVVAEMTASAPIAAEAWEWWPDFGVSIPTTRLRIRYGPLPAQGRLTFRVVERGPAS